jgi:AraC family transcriptional regulator, regulatory protein of adaptative response / DNA-3-methyladenine glycosylase II
MTSALASSSPGQTILEPEPCYLAMQTRDTRFDGRFFVAVRTTKIYCRPICKVRLPKAENCTFYVSAAAAEHAGYRPCLRCRPELAPGHFALDASSRLAQHMALMIEHSEPSTKLDAIAAKLGVTERHARRLFHDSFGVTPVQYSQTCRLLAAKRLLTDTDLPMLAVAHAAGFRSLRRFNDLFVGRYRLQPSALRKRRDEHGALDQTLEFRLPYRRPFDWLAMLEFLALREISGLESVQWETKAYQRRVALSLEGKRYVGDIEVRDLPEHDALSVRLSQSLAAVCVRLLKGLRQVFDLDLEPKQVALSLGALCENPGLRLPGGFTGFEIAVRAVLGQQVSVKGAHTLAARIVRRVGSDGCFPEPHELAAASMTVLRECGLVSKRAQCLIDLSVAVSEGGIVLDGSATLDTSLAALLTIKGIGDWTAQYVAMRALRWPDALPANDLVLKKRLGVNTAQQVEHAFEAYRPWRSYAVIHTWKRA